MAPRSRGGERAMVPPAEPRSYYGLPIVKRPAWTQEVPWYFFVGGTSGALAAAALAARWGRQDKLERRARRLALGGALISPVLLISDLGRPARFLNMLRVIRPTSPMSLGSWTLAGFGSALAASEAADTLGLPQVAVGTASLAAGILGPILSTYTAVLLGDTANPVWRSARHLLPFVFSGSSVAAAGGALCITNSVREGAPARRMVVAGTVLEQTAFFAMERHLGFLGEPYSDGVAGRLNGWQRTSSLAGAAVALTLGRRSRAAAAVGGLLSLAGSAALRLAIYRAGFQSAEDPRYVVDGQRSAPSSS